MKSIFNFLGSLIPKKFNDRSIKEETFCVIDTETTGLNVKSGDRIVSFAGVKIHSLELSKEVYDQLIDPERDLPLASSKIHGIFPWDLEGKPKIREVEHEISNFISTSSIVGHNVQFDQDCVVATMPMSELALKFKTNPVLDTFSLSISLFPELESYELSDLCNKFKIKPEPRHTALGDSIMTAKLLIILLNKALEKGAKSVYDLNKIMKQSYAISKHLKEKRHF